jgi:hypothetical protein
LDKLARITQQILVSILTGHGNVSAIRIDTKIHPEVLPAHLERLAKQGLIKVETKGWKRGKSKSCSITNVGIAWLVNVPLNETLQVLSKIVGQLRNTEYRGMFKNVRAEKFSRDLKIIRDYFIEKSLKGDKSPMKYPEGLDLTDPDQPFREALKKLFTLHLYLTSGDDATSEEVERSIENDFVLFAPHMTFVFSWHRGAFPELEYQLRQVDNYFRRESEKLQRKEENVMVSRETHLLGLEWVDEKYFEEYLKATDKKRREKIMAKIEEQAGWSVGAHLRSLLMGREAEIAKYVDGQKRPSLRKFISLFEKGRSK